MACIYARNGWWHLSWNDGGRRHTRSLKTKVESEAITAKEEIERRLRGGGDALRMLARLGGALEPPAVRAVTVDRLLQEAPRLLRNCRKNAAARGIPFDLEREWLDHLIRESGGHCTVSGIPFDLDFRINGRRPFAPSIDRGDCNGSYCMDNVQLVCVAVNQALHVWGPAVLCRLVEHLYPRLRNGSF